MDVRARFILVWGFFEMELRFGLGLSCFGEFAESGYLYSIAFSGVRRVMC